jgi:hypothetical protein
MNEVFRTRAEIAGLLLLLFLLILVGLQYQRAQVWHTNYVDARAGEQQMYEQKIKMEAQRDLALDMQRETMTLTIRCIESYNQ